MWLEEFWATIRLLNRNPKAEYIQMLGNHDVRPHKRLVEKCPDLEPFFDFRSAFEFIGVKTHFDPRAVVMVNGFACHHGWKSRFGSHAMELGNCIVGHTHKPGIHIVSYGGKKLIEVNCGYLADPLAKQLGYTATNVTTWSHAVAEVDEDGPRVILL